MVLAEHNRRFMNLSFIKRVAPAALWVGLIIFALPQSARAMTISGQFATLKIYFQERSALFGSFRVPLLLSTVYAEVNDDEREPSSFKKEPEELSVLEHLQEAQAAAIARYMQDRSMPLAHYSAPMVAKAYEYGIDWRILPAIAIRESSGGKFACGNNPFGWASCKVNFKSIEEAIDVVARNLGGHNPNTAVYYRGETAEKLQSYNGAVIPRYPEEVIRIMERIKEEF